MRGTRDHRPLRATVVAALLIAELVAGSRAGAALITPEKVIGGPGEQYGAFGDGTWIAYAEATNAAPNTPHAYAQRVGSATRIRLNPAGTRGMPGGFDPGTDHVIYDQWTDKDGDVYLYDISLRNRKKVGAVSSPWLEYGARISGSFIFFKRYVYRSGRWYADLLLFDRATEKTRRIGTWSDKWFFVLPGSVGDRYVSWYVCRSVCDVHVYDADTRITKVVPSTVGYHRWSPVVDEANEDLYFVASGDACGKNVGIWRVPVASLRQDPVKVTTLPRGVDTGYTMSLAPNDDATALDLLFARHLCLADTGDVYALRGVGALP